MRNLPLLLALPFMLHSTVATADDLPRLATCANKVFNEISRTQKWSGKAPATCPPSIVVEKRHDGVLVTVWEIRNIQGGWIRSAFSGAMGYGELARKKDLANAGSDILERARHLDRCLDSINSTNNPLDCRDRATKSYLAGGESGVENDRIIWLDDNGRHAVAEYSYGSSSATPDPPADLFTGQQIKPGLTIDLHMKQ